MRLAIGLLAVLLLTKPDGSRLWIDTTNNIVVSRAPGIGAAGTIVSTMMGTFYVREAPEDVARQLGWKP